MAMSRKHYREAAEILHDADYDADRFPNFTAAQAVAQIRKELAHMFKCDNSRFDRERFNTASTFDANTK